MESPPAQADTGLPSGHGLRPSIVPLVVQAAHAAGLRVAAHIETAEDFRLAARAGVDMFAHLPGYEMKKGADPRRYEIDAETAQLAGAMGVVITPTLSLSRNHAGPVEDSALTAEIQRIQRRNIQLLRRAGAQLVVGSDWFRRTAANEFLGKWPRQECGARWR